ncbi:MAG: helix-turn-helix domain-containing protein [Ktedonobacteraceae bacterium]|nr:helix-turn-helix domain-containing protein [Ktedonobacteraceae bacterium]
MKKPDEATPKYLLRTMRESHGWTQEELAEKIGTTGVTISRWESGITFPNRYFRKKLSILYGKSIQELGLMPEEQDASSGTNHPAVIIPADVASSFRPGPIFLFNEPLPAPEEVYGRKSEREILVSRTSRKASTSIIGPRRSGKTWLIHHLQYLATQELGSRFYVKYLDATMPSCSTVNGFVAEVLEEFKLPSSRSQQGLIAFEKGLKALQKKHINPVLCIDEFEGFGNRKEFTLDFFRALRAMTQKFGLTLIAVSRSPLSAIVGKDVETSGFFNIFEQLTLKPFSIEEAREFIQAKGTQADFTQQEYELMWKYGEEGKHQWPPLRLQLAGKMLLADRGQASNDPRNRQIFEQRLEEVYRGVVY